MAPNFREIPEKLTNAVGERTRAIVNAPAVQRVVDRVESLASREAERIARFAAPAWNAAHGWYSKREQREKVLLRVLGAVLGVIVLYNFVYVPIMGLGMGYGDQVETREQQLVQVRSMMRSYDRLKIELASTEQRTAPKDFSLFSVIEQSLTKSIGHEKIGSITPSDRAVPGGFQQYTVDLKLSALNLAQIVDVLYGVQTLPMPVTVSNLQVRQRDQDPHSYDVDMTCMALGRGA